MFSADLTVPVEIRRRTLHFARNIGLSPPYRVPVYTACTVSALLINYFLGKDMAWDTLNYHLYAGFSALNDRFTQDYFAAGVPSYFNPFAYIPFYAMVRAGFPALVIGSVFAAVHSIILWLTYELGMAVSPSTEPGTRVSTGLLAVVFAYMNPILIQEIGSCFADITTAELVLAGWVLLVTALHRPTKSLIIYAGLLLGAASALKMSNAIPAFAAFALFFVFPPPPLSRIGNAVRYAVSLGIGFVVVAAPWSYRLEKMFGNPLFPMLNNVFRSPDYTTAIQAHSRFIPHSLAAALWRPFAMISPAGMVHEELNAPDLRYAVLVALALISLTYWIWRRVAGARDATTPRVLVPSDRILVALCFGFSAGWFLWLSGSGNSRYFLPMACVAGVIDVGLLYRVTAGHPKIRGYVVAAVFSVQAIQLGLGTEFRWNGVPWGGQWFDISMPETLQTEPNLYFSIGSLSNSFIAPFLSKESSLVNFSGGYALGAEGVPGDRIRTLIRRHTPHLRVLVTGAKLYEESEMRVPRRVLVDDALERFGLRTDMTDCVTITIHGLPPALEIRIETSFPTEPQSHDTTYLVSCHVAAVGRADQSALLARRASVDVVFDRLEDACPELFQPRRPVTEHEGKGWRRAYTNTDLTARVSNGWVQLENSLPGGPPVFIGRENDWAKASLKLRCGFRAEIPYVDVVEAEQRPK